MAVFKKKSFHVYSFFLFVGPSIHLYANDVMEPLWPEHVNLYINVNRELHGLSHQFSRQDSSYPRAEN